MGLNIPVAIINSRNTLVSKIEMTPQGSEKVQPASRKINGLARLWVALQVRFIIFIIALKCYRSFPKAIRAARILQAFRKKAYGHTKIRRCVKVDGKYYLGIYLPAFPSKIFNRFIQTELKRAIPHNRPVNRMQAIQLAITNSCPLKCEHCFEWNNLNQQETFTTDELKKIINAFQPGGCTQFHFTGGEPLVRMKKLEALIRHTSKTSECWILTSGLNLTLENAGILKNAGATGVIISLDHFDSNIHNVFRGSDHAFDWAMKAVRNANKVKLVTAFSICMTRFFTSEKNLEQYAAFAKDCGVSFVQLLEPKAVGHYEGKAVTLSKNHFELLDKFYIDINFEKQYKDYPVFIYHGYYQRRMGCLSGGNRVMYIDSAGFINACPFCQTKSYDAHDIITEKLKVDQINIGGCPTYKV